MRYEKDPSEIMIGPSGHYHHFFVIFPIVSTCPYINNYVVKRIAKKLSSMLHDASPFWLTSTRGPGYMYLHVPSGDTGKCKS